MPSEWRTPPLWGVRDSGPLLHDGRAATLREAIKLHGGEGLRAAKKYAHLSEKQRGDLVAFLQTLVAPPDALRVPPKKRDECAGGGRILSTKGRSDEAESQQQ